MIVLIIYDERAAAMGDLAAAAAEGALSISGTEIRVRRLGEANINELNDAAGIILGSPNWSGMSARMKEFLDQGEDQWEYQQLVGRVGAAFTAARSRSSGNEITLLQLWHIMLANGMICVGLPWSQAMRSTSNSYYGPVAVGPAGPDDLEAARVLGRRVAEVARRLDLQNQGAV